MTALAQHGTAPGGEAAFLSRYAGLRDRLPGDRAARDAAADAFRAAGLPGPHEEAWKYTSLRPLADVTFETPLVLSDGAPALPAYLPALDGPRAVFVDGRFRADLSALPDAVAFTPFAVAPGAPAPAWPDGAMPPLVALNAMLAEDGACIDVAPGQDAGTLLLLNLAAAPPGSAFAIHPRHRIRLGAGARLTVLDVSCGTGLYLHNPVFEIDVADGATLIHVRLQDEAMEAFHLATVFASVGAGATYDAFALALGARLARVEIHANLAGADAVAHLNGAQVLRGRQHGDFTTVVAHAAPRGTSRQTVRNVLDGHARGVFQGRIAVARAAQKTDGYQMNQALLLSPDAEIDSKPELEIFADDVKCSHGATVGELDAEQMFYLRSRGVPAAEARAILVRAFLDEALEGIADPGARAVLDGALNARWEAMAA